MHLLRIFTFGFGLSVSLGGPTVVRAAMLEGTCAVSRGDDAAFSDRQRVIRFTDGREFTVLGFNHGNRDLQGGTADTLAKAQTARDLSRLLASDPPALADARDGLRFLRAHRFGFIAAEASPATVQANLISYAAIRARVNRLGADSADAQLLAFGPDFFFRLTAPGTPRLIGVEDEALGRAYLVALPAHAKAAADLQKAKFDSLVASKLSAFLNSLVARYPFFRPEKDDFVREARAKFTAQDFAKIEPFLRTRVEVMRAMKARDRHDVSQLVREQSSGVLFIGSAHLDSVADLLRDACLASSTSPEK